VNDLFRTSMPSPIGELSIVASDTAVVTIRWDTESPASQPDARNPLERTSTDGVRDVPADQHPMLGRAVRQLTEYFDGTRTEFDLPLAPAGTPFQLRAWEALRAIPFGETVSYGEQARRLGDRNKSRAVGAANGQNPIPIVLPCHRVVGSNGHLTGFGGGIEVKAWLLDHEWHVRAAT
jgi:methylated-DNA-[protein]-cysteine S-methyltransferase